MKNPPAKRKIPDFRLKRSVIIALLTACYAALFIAPVFSQWEGLNTEQNLFIQQALEALAAFVQVYCLIFGLTIFRLAWYVLWPLLCFVSALNYHMYTAFGIKVSKYAVAVVLEPKAREAVSFFTPELMFTMAAGCVLALLGIFLIRREQPEPQNRPGACIALCIALGLIMINKGGLSTRFAPYDVLNAAYQYAYESVWFILPKRTNIGALPASRTPSEEPLVVVMVIGESARADHFSINGYKRETTPLLEKRKNLVNFKDTKACGVFTRVAVPCMLSRATPQNMTVMYNETSVISVFKKLGFRTSWLSTHGILYSNYPVTPITLEADTHFMVEDQQVLDNTTKDEQLLPILDHELNALDDKSAFIVLHTYGSHWQYSARYPKQFARYQPICGMSFSKESRMPSDQQTEEIKECAHNIDALVNSYDNSILYTDYVLDEVIKRLEHKNALFVYVSDHGESLGENGRFLHGHESAPENVQVPMFWWASDSFIAANKKRWQSLSQKSASPSSHFVLFHSLLDCAGVHSQLIDPAKSVCHSNKE